MTAAKLLRKIGRVFWPKSLLRRAFVITLVACVIAGVFGWRSLTRPQRIQRLLVENIREHTGLEAEIGELRYSFPDEIEIDSLRLYQKDKDTLVRARYCEIDLDISAIIADSGFALDEISLDEATITITENLSDGSWNFPSLVSGEYPLEIEAIKFPEKMPSVSITNSTVMRRQLWDGASEFIAQWPLEVKSNLDYELFAWSYQLSLGSEITSALSCDRKNIVHLEADFALDDLLKLGSDQARSFAASRSLSGDVGVSAILSEPGPAGTLHIDSASIDSVTLGSIFNVRDLRGYIDFDTRGFNIRSMNCRLPNFGDSQAAVSGVVDGFSPDSPVVIQCSLADISMPLDVDDSKLGRIISKAQHQCSLRGDTDITVKLSRDLGGPFDYEGSASFDDMSIEAAYFPYELKSVSGRIDFDSSRVLLNGLKATDGNQLFDVSGFVSLAERDVFDVTITGHSLELNDKFRDAFFESSLHEISEEISQYYSDFNLEGRGNASTRVWCEGLAHPVKTSVDILADGQLSVSYSDFPYRVNEVVGTVNITPEGFTANGLKGKSGAGEITLSANGDWSGDDFVLALDISGRDISLDDKLALSLDKLSELAGSQYRKFNLSGSSDFDCRIDIDGDDFDWHTVVRPKGASLVYDGFVHPLEAVTGTLDITPEQVKVENLGGISVADNGTSLTVNGTVSLADFGEGSPADLNFDIKNLSLDDRLKGAVNSAYPEIIPLWDSLNPSGRSDVRFAMVTAAENKWTLDAQLKGATIRWKNLPLDIKDIQGYIIADSRHVLLDGINAVAASGKLNLDGEFATDELSLTGGKFSASASDIILDKELLDALPESLEMAGRILAPAGTADISIEHGGFTLGENALWYAKGKAGFENAGLSLGLEIDGITGEMDFDMKMADSLELDANFTASKASFGTRPAIGLVGTINKPAADEQLSVHLDGGFCGGRLNCDSEVFLAEPISYELGLLLEGAELKCLLANESDVHGQFDGTLKMRQTLGEPDSLEGAGDFRLRDGRIAKAPLILGLTNVIFLQLPVESVFSSGSGSYALKGQQVFCRQLSLKGRDVSLLGSSGRNLEGVGKVDLSDKTLDLVFVVGPPAIIKGPMRQLWNLTASGVAKFHVFGPWDNPAVKTAAFDNFVKLLGEMGVGK